MIDAFREAKAWIQARGTERGLHLASGQPRDQQS